MTDLSGNPEVVYWRRYEQGILVNNVQSYHRSYNGGATKSLVEDYLCKDGLPITLSPLYKGDAVYTDIFVDRDPRLRQTVLHPDDQAIFNYGNHAFGARTYPRVQGVGGQTTYTGYHIIKGFLASASYAGYNSGTHPAITLRFAEALLNYAESKAELGGGTISQADLDISINLLRDRVGMPHLSATPPMDPRYAGDGVSAVLVEIRRERRLELFMEGSFRYDDLRRWKQGKKLEMKDYGIRWDQSYKDLYDPTKKVTVKSSLVNGIEYLEPYKGTDYENPVFDEGKHYLWPLPISVISQNPKLGQNPGWE
ncbi:MAG: RagB/SusD family nutrient uptake outer membrane protein [Cyclobacteriaceae bacterium]|nr:RagB/SusD family nutrient uptake outer membrane protein [Cyclobacteriaceae bacterium]